VAFVSHQSPSSPLVPSLLVVISWRQLLSVIVIGHQLSVISGLHQLSVTVVVIVVLVGFVCRQWLSPVVGVDDGGWSSSVVVIGCCHQSLLSVAIISCGWSSVMVVCHRLSVIVVGHHCRSSCHGQVTVSFSCLSLGVFRQGYFLKRKPFRRFD